MSPEEISARFSLRDVEYIGDGAYVGHDSFQLWVLTEREDGWHRLALDRPTFSSLVVYGRRLGFS